SRSVKNANGSGLRQTEVRLAPSCVTALAVVVEDQTFDRRSNPVGVSAEGSESGGAPASLSQGSATPSGPTRTANGSGASRRRAARAVAASPAAHQVGLLGGSPTRWAALSKISR